MKNTISLIVLAVLCLGLALTLWLRHNRATTERAADSRTIADLSNNWQKSELQLSESRLVIAAHESDISNRDLRITQLHATLTGASNDLSRTRQDLTDTRATVQTLQAEVSKRDAQINALESEKLDLDRRAQELTNAIAGLNVQIAETQRKLAMAEGDKAFLEGELKKLMTEKADLEKKFNDLEIVREQLKQLKEELNVARRIDMIRRGIFAGSEQKGGQRLMNVAERSKSPPPPPPNYDLNVEIRSDGGARVVPPATNAPPRQ